MPSRRGCQHEPVRVGARPWTPAFCSFPLFVPHVWRLAFPVVWCRQAVISQGRDKVVFIQLFLGGNRQGAWGKRGAAGDGDITEQSVYCVSHFPSRFKDLQVIIFNRCVSIFKGLLYLNWILTLFVKKYSGTMTSFRFFMWEILQSLYV